MSGRIGAAAAQSYSGGGGLAIGMTGAVAARLRSARARAHIARPARAHAKVKKTPRLIRVMVTHQATIFSYNY